MSDVCDVEFIFCFSGSINSLALFFIVQYAGFAVAIINSKTIDTYKKNSYRGCIKFRRL